MKPDYKQYSYDGLVSALATIDRDKWPDRVKEIEERLKSPSLQGERKKLEQIRDKKNKTYAETILYRSYGIVIAGPVFIAYDLVFNSNDTHVELFLYTFFIISTLVIYNLRRYVKGQWGK